MPDLLRGVAREDAEALVTLLAELERADESGEHYNLEDVHEEMDNALVDAGVDWLVVEREGRLVGVSMLQPRAPDGGAMRVALNGGVHPDLRRQGLGGRLMDAAVARVRAHVAERDPSVRPVVAVDARPEDVGLVDLAVRHGLAPEMWSFAMLAELPRTGGAGAVPEGYALETWERVDHDEVRAAHNRAFAGHRGWTPWDEEMWRTWVSGARHHRPALSLLLRDGAGEVAAYVHTCEYDATEQATGVKEAYVSKLGTAPGHRGQGLGAALLRLALDRAAAQGFRRASLDVDAHNETGALRVYEGAGFVVARRWVTYSDVAH